MFQARLSRQALSSCLTLIALVVVNFFVFPVLAAEKARLRVENYDIDAELNPRAHKLTAKARVRFTALDDLSAATFELHNALRPTKVTDEAGKMLQVERISQDNAIRVGLPDGLGKGKTTTLNFEYEGTLESVDDSPVPGVKLASVGEDTSYLLYAGRWFPVSNYGINRFTATIRVTLPAHMTVIGSGTPTVTNFGESKPLPAAGDKPLPEKDFPVLSRKKAAASKSTKSVTKKAPPAAGKAKADAAKTDAKAAPEVTEPTKSDSAQNGPSSALPRKTWTFTWDKPSFPGTIIAGIFTETKPAGTGANVHVFFKPAKQVYANAYGETAGKEFVYYAGLYSASLTPTLKLVELPDDSVPSAWAPEIAAISSRAIQQKTNYRLLANTIARQWWGGIVSPATRDDWWITDGFARFSEARYVENAVGATGYEEVAKDMTVGSLAYDTVPLSSLGKLDPFSPEFQSLATDKGAAILHMLRYVMGDEKFDNTMRGFVLKHSLQSAGEEDFRKEAEEHQGSSLVWFFSQWLDSTGAPEFKTKYTVYRLGSNKGFRTVGEITQDLDLFRMPVTLRIDTDGKTEERIINVSGTDSPFTVETFGRPRRIVIDPDDHVLKNSPDIRLRTALLRGQQMVQTGELAEALKEFASALEANKNSSLAHYRIAEVFFQQRNYQAAANAYRESINGDGDPRWTEVWSHVQLGKIFDVTGQRERATNEYRHALETNDNTEGAQDEARKYLKQPYEKSKTSSGLP
jgi:Peptidase family M1 domain/Tetratricopeptide repeat-like domain